MHQLHNPPGLLPIWLLKNIGYNSIISETKNNNKTQVLKVTSYLWPVI